MWFREDDIFCYLLIFLKRTELLKYIKKEKLSLKVYEKNTKAIKFYIKNSFRLKSRELDKSTGEFEYLMEWNLE